ncbi:MAG: alpha-2-macroglobulin, partial [Candidatus Latescibacteria bacterium]|nr:alpha-2-macroglobulin [Candidatus Latescibacterota bacterium]
FMETDEVVLSANVHNYLETGKTARVSLEVPGEILELIGETPATVDVEVPAGGETRVDWRVKVLAEGVANVLVKALTDEESDAVQVAFPVLVHGMTKQVATTGSMRPEDDGKTVTVELDVPEKRRPELTRFEINYTPTLAGAMLDALPYCLNYPYGCTEQTVSRFLPAVLTRRTLQNFGIDLEDVAEIRRGRMEEIRKIEEGEKIILWSYYADSAIFDEEGLQKVIDESLIRIESMQNGDGGWGWWSRDDSSAYLTSYVLFALATARETDVAVDQNVIERGMRYLKGWEEGRLRNAPWSPSPTHAFVAYVLSLQKLRAAIEPGEDDERPGDLIERLWIGRDELNLYAKSLLALAMANLEDERAKTVLENILQYVEVNEETQSAHFRTPGAGWWYWWNHDIETNAWVLRALAKIDPESEVSPMVVKWLLGNRRGGYYWTSTRDTTLCVAAMSDFVAATGEASPDYTLRIDLDDGAVVKEVKINADNFFTYDNRFLVEGVALSGGRHTVKITKTGRGALYFNTYLSYFTKEDHIGAAGHELKVDRRYFRLEQIPYEVEVEGAEGQPVKERRLRYERIPVRSGDEVKSGDILQVELRVTADNSYTFLAFEDMKPAGCEPLDLRSGGKGQEGFLTYMELRDEKVVFFMSALDQGEHLLRYRLRAEIPGRFHALPAKLYAMYAPKLEANSEECVIRILDD